MFDNYDHILIRDNRKYKIENVKTSNELVLSITTSSIQCIITPSWDVCVTGSDKQKVETFLVNMEMVMNQKRLLKIKIKTEIDRSGIVKNLINTISENNFNNDRTVSKFTELFRWANDLTFSTPVGGLAIVIIPILNLLNINEEILNNFITLYSQIVPSILFATAIYLKLKPTLD